MNQNFLNFFFVSILFFCILIFVFMIHIHADHMDPYDSHMDPPETIDDGLYGVHNTINISEQDLLCLARNIFFEAGIESYEGKIAVAQVTWNRVQSGRWGNTICEVVNARHQFSWTNLKKRPHPRGPLWNESVLAAQDFVNGIRLDELNYSLHFHAYFVDPQWNRNMEVASRIGRHIFYVN